MRILLTNDDGIDAPGIRALHAAITPDTSPLGEVFTVAPLTVQSATSHGVTFNQPLMIRPTTINGGPAVAVDGRPADCVKLALTELWAERFGTKTRPDLVISGMNAGANVGINVLYSGTVAAALEAAFLGVPSIAVSLHLGAGRPDFHAAAQHARIAIDRVLATGLLDAHGCVSINIPRTEAPEGADGGIDDTELALARADAGLPPQPMHARAAESLPARTGTPDIIVCPMNCHGIADRFDKRQSPAGQSYYWSAAAGLDFHGTDVGSDVDELFKGNITVTPLRYDLTVHENLGRWRGALDRSPRFET